MAIGGYGVQQPVEGSRGSTHWTVPPHPQGPASASSSSAVPKAAAEAPSQDVQIVGDGTHLWLHNDTYDFIARELGDPHKAIACVQQLQVCALFVLRLARAPSVCGFAGVGGGNPPPPFPTAEWQHACTCCAPLIGDT